MAYESRPTPIIHKEVFERINAYFLNLSFKKPCYMRNYIIFQCLWTFGTRIGETLKINIRDVDFINNQLRIPPENEKTGKNKLFHIPVKDNFRSIFYGYISKYRHFFKDGFIFFSQKSKNFGYVGWKAIWNKMLILLGLFEETDFYDSIGHRYTKYRTHGIRVRRFTELLKIHPPQIVQALSQHTSIVPLVDIYNRMNKMKVQEDILEVK